MIFKKKSLNISLCVLLVLVPMQATEKRKKHTQTKDWLISKNVGWGLVALTAVATLGSWLYEKFTEPTITQRDRNIDIEVDTETATERAINDQNLKKKEEEKEKEKINSAFDRHVDHKESTDPFTVHSKIQTVENKDLENNNSESVITKREASNTGKKSFKEKYNHFMKIRTQSFQDKIDQSKTMEEILALPPIKKLPN